jgi:hypothetical protein
MRVEFELLLSRRPRGEELAYSLNVPKGPMRSSSFFSRGWLWVMYAAGSANCVAACSLALGVQRRGLMLVSRPTGNVPGKYERNAASPGFVTMGCWVVRLPHASPVLSVEPLATAL